jgi:two-component system KDP operon response regulator KdpE
VSVLVVEDDAAAAEIVTIALRARGHRVEVATTGRAALEAASAHEPDVVVLDLGLPDLDGIAVCRELRRWFPNPILVLSADGAEDRKIAALDEGADDYVTKPFSMPELLARLRVAVRHRRAVGSVLDPGRIEAGDLVIHVASYSASVGGQPLELRKKEFELLAFLARHPGKVLTHGTLLDKVWLSARTASIESLRVHITQLRKRLGEGPLRPTILTEPGVGYRLVLPDAHAVHRPATSI